jgi:hypothetical protein
VMVQSLSTQPWTKSFRTLMRRYTTTHYLVSAFLVSNQAGLLLMRLEEYVTIQRNIVI